MFSTHTLPLLIQHLKITRLIGNFPFEFDSKSRKLVLMKSRLRVKISKIQSLITLSYFLVLLYNSFLGDMPVLKRLQGFPFIIFYMVLIPCGWNMGLDIAPMQMINSILAFERDLVEGKKVCKYLTTIWHVKCVCNS